MEKCPACDGKKLVIAFVDGVREDRPFGEVRELICYRCKGDGEVPTEMLEWMKVGAERRKERVARFESQRDAAKRLGIDAVTLSKMEMGLMSWQDEEGMN